MNTFSVWKIIDRFFHSIFIKRIVTRNMILCNRMIVIFENIPAFNFSWNVVISIPLFVIFERGVYNSVCWIRNTLNRKLSKILILPFTRNKKKKYNKKCQNFLHRFFLLKKYQEKLSLDTIKVRHYLIKP